jgi:hypothetical protein
MTRIKAILETVNHSDDVIDTKVQSFGPNLWNWLENNFNAGKEKLGNWTPAQRIYNSLGGVGSNYDLKFRNAPYYPGTHAKDLTPKYDPFTHVKDIVWDLTLGGALQQTKANLTGTQPELVNVLPGATALARIPSYEKGYEIVQSTPGGRATADIWLTALGIGQTAGAGKALLNANRSVGTGVYVRGKEQMTRPVGMPQVKQAVKLGGVIGGSLMARNMLAASREQAKATRESVPKVTVNVPPMPTSVIQYTPPSTPTTPGNVNNYYTTEPEKNNAMLDLIKGQLDQQQASSDALWAGLFGVLAGMGQGGGGSGGQVIQYMPPKGDSSGVFGGGSGAPSAASRVSQQNRKRKVLSAPSEPESRKIGAMSRKAIQTD